MFVFPHHGEYWCIRRVTSSVTNRVSGGSDSNFLSLFRKSVVPEKMMQRGHAWLQKAAHKARDVDCFLPYGTIIYEFVLGEAGMRVPADPEQ